MRTYHIILVIFITALVLSCPTDPNPGPAEVLVPEDFAGMCHTGYSNHLVREYEIINEMGIVWVHWDFSWSSIQPDNGDQWNFDGAIGNRTNFDSRVQRANTEDKKIIGMLLYGNGWIHTDCEQALLPLNERSSRIICNAAEVQHFVDYSVETVKRYNGKQGSAGKVDAWFIWNEPDHPRFWIGSHEQFFNLTKATAAAIRELDAEQGTTTTLVGGVFSPLVAQDWNWITGLFGSGAMDQVDGIAYHPYNPSAESSLGNYRNFVQKVKPYGFHDKIWVNEMGYPTYSEKGALANLLQRPDGSPGRYGLDQYEGDMPEVVTKTFVLLAAAGARNLTWYHLFDGPGRADGNNIYNSESWFGLVWRENDNDWHKKGGYWGFAIAANNIPGKTYRNKQFFSGSAPNNIHSYYFEGSDGKHTLVVWNSHPLRDTDVTIALNGSNHKLWDVETGESESVAGTSTHTLYRANNYQKTLVFFTWDG